MSTAPAGAGNWSWSEDTICAPVAVPPPPGDDVPAYTFSQRWVDAIRADPAYQAALVEHAEDDASELHARGGVLYHGTRVVVPFDEDLRLLLLIEAHDTVTAGHTGVESTLDRLTRRFYWSGVASDVHDYVLSCDSCQRNKVEQRRPAGLLRPPPVPDEPGYAINMDFVFGLPRTKGGHTGYLSLTCRLSNWLQVALCDDTVTAEGAAQLVFDAWVCTFGLPSIIISDRDPRFTGRFWRALWSLLDTKLHMSTGGHPQTDGKAENRQRTANTMLRHYVDFEQSNWDTCLLKATFAVNHTKSVSTGLTPFEVMFRRSPRLPLDAALDTLRSQVDPAHGHVPAASNFLERHRYIWQAAKANLLKAQESQKRFADAHRREETFAIGEEVLLSTRDLTLASDPKHKRAAKLLARFVGPFKITGIINDNAYRLALPPQLRGVHDVQNISKLRRYHASPVGRFDGRPQPSPRPPPEFADAAGDHYEVERVLARRTIGRGRHGHVIQYLIQWKGYPYEDASWEPAKNVSGASELIAEFEERQLLADIDQA